MPAGEATALVMNLPGSVVELVNFFVRRRIGDVGVTTFALVELGDVGDAGDARDVGSLRDAGDGRPGDKELKIGDTKSIKSSWRILVDTDERHDECLARCAAARRGSVDAPTLASLTKIGDCDDLHTLQPPTQRRRLSDPNHVALVAVKAWVAWVRLPKTWTKKTQDLSSKLSKPGKKRRHSAHSRSRDAFSPVTRTQVCDALLAFGCTLCGREVRGFPIYHVPPP